jgi:hypothetical protein
MKSRWEQKQWEAVELAKHVGFWDRNEDGVVDSESYAERERAEAALRAALDEQTRLVREMLNEMGEWAAHQTALKPDPDDGPDSLDIADKADAILNEQPTEDNDV